MDIRIDVSTDDDGRSVVAVAGAIDLQTRDQVRSAGQDALGGGARELVLDLSEVSFIDSTGIGSLVELSHDAADAEAALVIRAPSTRVRRILELTGLADAWEIEPA